MGKKIVKISTRKKANRVICYDAPFYGKDPFIHSMMNARITDTEDQYDYDNKS